MLKFALPSIGVILAVGFAAFSLMSTPPSGPIAKQTAEVAEGELVMANPKLEGFTKDGQRYSMNAGRAVQDFEQQGVVTLHGIDANMPIDKGKWARVQTESGVFDRNENTLDVTTDITVTTSDGMVANLQVRVSGHQQWQLENKRSGRYPSERLENFRRVNVDPRQWQACYLREQCPIEH